MALIKGKQIQSVPAAKVVETVGKKFVTDEQIVLFTGKAEVADVTKAVGDAKTELGQTVTATKEALELDITTTKEEITKKLTATQETLGSNINTTKAELELNITQSQTQAVIAAGEYTNAEVVKVNEKVKTVDTRLTTAEAGLATGLEARYTRAEVDQKLAQLGTGIKYKGTVASFDEIATRFPTAEEGWLVAVEGSKKFYVYDADTQAWDEFPIEMAPCTTHTKMIRLIVTDNQTVINTGIRTDGTGVLQTSPQLAEEVIVGVNGFEQIKTTDFTIDASTKEIVLTWLNSGFALEASDAVTVTYNQIV